MRARQENPVFQVLRQSLLQAFLGDFRPLIRAVLLGYIVGMLGHTVYSIARSDASWSHTFVFVIARFLILFVGPYAILLNIRKNLTRERLRKEDYVTRRERNYYASAFLQPQKDIVTIFFPDLYQDEHSVCAYTGGLGSRFRQYCTVRHLHAASIVANPHIAFFDGKSGTSQRFVLPELKVVRLNSLLLRFDHWLRDFIYYVFYAQERINIPHLYDSREISPGEEANRLEIQHALTMTREVLNNLSNSRGFVLFGSGRGANVAFCVYCQLTESEREKVKGVILEGLVTRPWLRYYGNPIGNLQVHQDKKNVARFLLVVSYADTLSSTEGFDEFSSRLRVKVGTDRLTTLFLNHATHGSYATHNPYDALAFEKTAFEFYSNIDEDISLSVLKPAGS